MRPSGGQGTVTRRHRNLLLATSILTFLLITFGGIVCVTDSSQGCPDWPGCYGKLLPPMRIDSVLEFTHRVMAVLTSLFIVASAIAGLRFARSIRWVAYPPLIALFFLLAVSIFGAMVVLRGLEPGLAALDLASALAVLALMIAATVVAFARRQNPALPDRLLFSGSLARLSFWTAVAVFVVLVSGVLVAAEGSSVRCLGWPLYGGPLPLLDLRGWLQLARGLLAGATGFLVVALVVHAWRRPGAIRVAALIVGACFVIEMVVGVPMALDGSLVYLQVTHTAVAAALWASLVVLVVRTGLASIANTSTPNCQTVSP